MLFSYVSSSATTYSEITWKYKLTDFLFSIHQTFVYSCMVMLILFTFLDHDYVTSYTIQLFSDTCWKNPNTSLLINGVDKVVCMDAVLLLQVDCARG